MTSKKLPCFRLMKWKGNLRKRIRRFRMIIKYSNKLTKNQLWNSKFFSLLLRFKWRMTLLNKPRQRNWAILSKMLKLLSMKCRLRFLMACRLKAIGKLMSRSLTQVSPQMVHNLVLKNPKERVNVVMGRTSQIQLLRLSQPVNRLKWKTQQNRL